MFVRGLQLPLLPMSCSITLEALLGRGLVHCIRSFSQENFPIDAFTLAVCRSDFTSYDCGILGGFKKGKFPDT